MKTREEQSARAAERDDGPPDRTSEREAQRLLKDCARMLAKHRRRLKTEEIERVETAMRAVVEALETPGTGTRRLGTAMKGLDDAVHEVLGFAKKSSAREFFESIAVAVLVAAILRAFVIEAFKIPSGSMIPTLEVGDHIFVNKYIYGLRVPFTNAWFVEWGAAERGDVIVFRYPRDLSKDYIKRVVAVAGDRVRVEGREVWVNGAKLDRATPADYSYVEDAEPGEEAGFPAARRAYAYSEKSLGEQPKEYTVLYSAEEVARPPFPAGHELPGLDCTYDEPGRVSECRVEDDYLFVMGDNRDNSADSRAWGGVPTSYVKGRAMFVWWSRGARSGIRWGRMGQGIE